MVHDPSLSCTQHQQQPVAAGYGARLAQETPVTGLMDARTSEDVAVSITTKTRLVKNATLRDFTATASRRTGIAVVATSLESDVDDDGGAGPAREAPSRKRTRAATSEGVSDSNATRARSSKSATPRGTTATSSRKSRKAPDAPPVRRYVDGGDTISAHEAFFPRRTRAVTSKGVSDSNATRARSSKSAKPRGTTATSSRKARMGPYAPPAGKYVDGGGTRSAHEAFFPKRTRAVTSKGVSDSNATRARSSKSATPRGTTATSSRKARMGPYAPPAGKYVDGGGTRFAQEAPYRRRTRAVTSKGVSDSNATRARPSKSATPRGTTATSSQKARTPSDAPPVRKFVDAGGIRPAHEALSLRRTRAVTSKGVSDSNAIRARPSKSATPADSTATIPQKARKAPDAPPPEKYMYDGGATCAHEDSSAKWTHATTCTGVADSNATRENSAKPAKPTTPKNATNMTSWGASKASDAPPRAHVFNDGDAGPAQAFSSRSTRAGTSDGVTHSHVTEEGSAKPATPMIATAATTPCTGDVVDGLQPKSAATAEEHGEPSSEAPSWGRSRTGAQRLFSSLGLRTIDIVHGAALLTAAVEVRGSRGRKRRRVP
ncbi:uncharacterized protein [Dermacentor albipictus]|uniref:uncharacterized protein n=1 Tax=Dermacentor albipictus TaxID=60249 RepID=UPI0038FD139C